MSPLQELSHHANTKSSDIDANNHSLLRRLEPQQRNEAMPVNSAATTSRNTTGSNGSITANRTIVVVDGGILLSSTGTSNTLLSDIPVTTNINGENKRPREPCDHDEKEGARKEKARPLVTDTANASSNATATSNPTITNSTCTKRTFAPSVDAYLKQVPSQNNKDGAPVLKYLPRPEWFKIIRYMIYTELKKMKHKYNFNMTHAMDMGVPDYNRHLKRCVTNKILETRSIFYVRNAGSTEEDSSDSDESNEYMKDDLEESMVRNESEVGQSPENRMDSKTAHRNDSKSKEQQQLQWGSHIRKKIAFVKAQLTSNVVDFDVNLFIWKTKCLPSNTPMIRSDPTTKVNWETKDTTPYSPDHNHYQISFETFIQRERVAKNSIGKAGNTILHVAIQANATEAAIDIIRIEYNTVLDYDRSSQGDKDYLELRTFLESANKRGFTPLIIAARKGNIQIMDALLNCGVAINGVSKNFWHSSCSTAIVQAAHFGQTKAIAHMIDYYQRHDATRSGGSMFWPKSLKDFIDEPNERMTTPLMRAAQEGHISTVNLLVKHGAECNRSNKAGMTPLIFAAQRGHKDICRFLINHDADINAQTIQKSTALLLACKHGHVAVVKALLVAGCELYHTNKRNYTVRHVIQHLIDWHRSLPEFRSDPTRPQNHQYFIEARSRFEECVMDGDDDDCGDAAEYDNFALIPIDTYQKIVYILDPCIQIELTRHSERVQRNYEIIRLYTLLQRQRADFKIMDGSTYYLSTVVQCLTNMQSIADDSDFDTPSLDHLQQNKLEDYLTELPNCTQMLLRTMLLPATLVRTVALFCPLPALWRERLDRLDCVIGHNSNEAVVLTLDIIDEMLEDGGFLMACDEAQIPAPIPHQTWCDWKRSAAPIEICSGLDSKRWNLPNEHQVDSQLSVTASSPPSPRDEKNPTIRELRRLVGYSSLLSQFRSQTDIVPILLEEPFGIPQTSLNKLIRIADLASLCRRCLESRGSIESSGIKFDHEAAYDVLDLAEELFDWRVNRT